MIYLNDVPINVTLFPDNTSQVWKIDFAKTRYPIVSWDFQNEGEFMELAQLKYLLDVYAFKVILEIYYLPYARQDKEVSNGNTFALIPFADLLNRLKFWKILILDPHSDQALKLIKHSEAVYPLKQIRETLSNIQPDMICYPDQGALTKYSKIIDYNSMFGIKTRDPNTGKIMSYELHGDPAGKNILIVDDICDGGATFIELVKLLKLKNCKAVSLFVTHGIFSKGTKILKDAGIEKIFTGRDRFKMELRK